MSSFFSETLNHHISLGSMCWKLFKEIPRNIDHLSNVLNFMLIWYYLQLQL